MSHKQQHEHSFMLDEGSFFLLDEVMPITPRWMELQHAPERERCLIIIAGECLRTPVLTAPREPILWLRCMRGLPRISIDGLDVDVRLLTEQGDAVSVLAIHINNELPSAGLHELQLGLPILAGRRFRLELRCGPGPQQRPEADWLAISGLVVSARGELSQWRARTQSAWRLENELAHFSSVYQGAFYKHRQHVRGGARVRALRTLPETGPDARDKENRELLARLHCQAKAFEPVPEENAFNFTHRLLAELLHQKTPDYAARLTALSEHASGRSVRMLALCAGEAAVEGRILATAGVPVELCLVDVNGPMLECAAERMPRNVLVDRVLGDANRIGMQLGRFDIVVITSGLHHLVELEKVLSAIAGVLLPGGEFWLIGEQVGRNGNRLWPEARSEAERLFASWPEQKRFNHNTGTVDATLPDRDFSAACFEGIRSEEILDQVARHFLPVDICELDGFLWRLVDVAYAANFDIADPLDRSILVEATIAEALHWARGGRGTALHGVYRSKWAEVAASVIPVTASE